MLIILSLITQSHRIRHWGLSASRPEWACTHVEAGWVEDCEDDESAWAPPLWGQAEIVRAL